MEGGVINLLPDQIALLQQAREKVGSGCKSLLIQGCTGSGKTVIASEIVAGAYNKGKTCFFIVPRRDLLRQTSATLKEFRIPHSFIAAGYRCDTRAKIFVCSMNTVKNRMAIVPDIAIIDEGHVGAAGMDKIVARYKAAGTVIILLSATPWKLSGRGLGCWVDDMVCGPSMRWLIENKRLSEFRAFAPNTPDLSGIKVVAGDYAHKQLNERMESDRVLVGNAVKHYQTHALGKLNIAYCVSIAHSKITAQAFNDAGISAAHIDGETPDDERVRIIKAYARRELLVLTNCELLTYGFDLSSASGMDVTVESMSDLRPTKSLALQLQKWGRVLRYKPYPAMIFDHSNNIREFGLPDADREWTLSDRDRRLGNDGEKSIPVKQCLPAEDADGVVRGCHFCHKPAPSCPNCGRVYVIQAREIDEVDGELAEIQAAIASKEKRQQNGRAKTLADLHAIASERGYKKGWIYKQAQLKGIRE
jgi:superfamily II DNA or RNA helicase